MLPNPSILVTTFVNPDLDGVASVLGQWEFLRKLKKPALAGISGTISQQAKLGLTLARLPEPKPIDHPETYEKIILVHCSDPQLIDTRISPMRVTQVIDNCEVRNARSFPYAQFHMAPVGTTATIVTEFFILHDIEPAIEIALLLYIAIRAYTCSPCCEVFTQRDERATRWLKLQLKISAKLDEQILAARKCQCKDSCSCTSTYPTASSNWQ